MKPALVVLAAGASRRFGTENKLLQPLAGKPLLCHTLERAAALPVARRVAVCSAESAPLAEAAGFTVVLNPQPELGQSHSLIAAWQGDPGGIWGCDFEGRFSIPSIFPAAVYGELLAQDGDVGGREVMRAHPELVHTIPAPPQEHFDIDTVADLAAAQQK